MKTLVSVLYFSMKKKKKIEYVILLKKRIKEKGKGRTASLPTAASSICTQTAGAEILPDETHN